MNLKKPYLKFLIAGVVIVSSISVFTVYKFAQGNVRKKVTLNILATADIHGKICSEEYKTSNGKTKVCETQNGLDRIFTYVKAERKKDPNTMLIDSGDFFDGAVDTPEMCCWFYTLNKKGELPMSKAMGFMKYDAVTIGNHELVSNTKKSLDNVLKYYKKRNVNVLSANIYTSKSKNYVSPYIIKNIKTPYGNLKVGILGLTIKEFGEKCYPKTGYEGILEVKDLVIEAKKWVKIMKKNGADVVVATIHSGEEPKKPRHPGNRIKEIARNVSGIDCIVCAHTHLLIQQHIYKNVDGRTVLVTQPGKMAEYLSRIQINVDKINGKWKILNKKSSVVKITSKLKADSTMRKMFQPCIIMGIKTQEKWNKDSMAALIKFIDEHPEVAKKHPEFMKEYLRLKNQK